MFLQFENAPVVSTNAFENAVPVKQTVIEDGDLRIAFSIIFPVDRKSTRLNSSHGYISYAVFCLKKKNCHACGWLLMLPTISHESPPFSLCKSADGSTPHPNSFREQPGSPHQKFTTARPSPSGHA